MKGDTCSYPTLATLPDESHYKIPAPNHAAGFRDCSVQGDSDKEAWRVPED